MHPCFSFGLVRVIFLFLFRRAADSGSMARVTEHRAAFSGRMDASVKIKNQKTIARFFIMGRFV